ncbi:MAG TPA: DUF4386 domain-containing protein [Kaistiaceae bacterium]|nr:DUF4386 domain-containing protein [Kaistiaceae bacterium]
MHAFSDPQSRGYARLAGIFYLIVVIAGVFAIAYVPTRLQVAGDPAATIASILDRRGLFTLGIGGDVVVMLAEIMVTAMLYLMFRPVNETLSLAAALARLAMVAVMATMLFFHAALVTFADPSGSVTGLSVAQRTDLASAMLHVHDAGVWIWQVFFTLHLALLGQLVAASGAYPKLLGHAMTLGAFGYLLDSVYSFAAPDLAILGHVRAGLLAIVTLAEIGFALWLVIRGPRPSGPSTITTG